ncbi:hypothetical protein F5984_11780 [Rudanella paleaurantiibacter]|uniref:ImmA/IrrE family metallo-endopeptidase n=1 Tax=Rudanella paleaurantiibacter TaxID=2614655 RepID=A0A7J5U1N5_9BACT|nr:hypothetical protein [Rudanella paleaurantiibacter]KAB7731461.1 hypothetical protein F5984_11780 [Rudanella paleaurantiibacter]
MARTKNNPNQLSIDFLASFRRMLVSLGSADKLIYNESVFTRLTDQWESKRVIPADLLFQKSPVEAVVYRLQKQDSRLRFPDEMIAGELRGVEGLTGFAAKFREQGWVILPAELSGMYKNLFLNILTAAIGLDHAYTSKQELLPEAERVALAALLPEEEVRKFFGIRLSRFPDSFRSEVSNYFNLPFESVMKRALHIGAITEEVLEENLNNRQPIRSTTLRRPSSSRAA